MKKFLNRETIIGKVYDHKLALKTSGPNSKNPGTEYIAGDIEIATDREGLNVVSVHFTYETATRKSGSANTTFTALKDIIDNNKTILAVGMDDATAVNISTSLGLNDFVTNRNGQEEWVHAKRNDGGFVNIVRAVDYSKPTNKFDFDMLINGTRYVEADPEKNITEDYLIVKGAVFNDFRKSILPIELVCRDKDGMKYFESLDASPQNMILNHVWGTINSQTITTTRTEESAFGAAAVTTFERKVKEWTIIGANPDNKIVDNDCEDLTPEELKEMLSKRELDLADIKKRAEEYQASKAANAGGGFTASAQTAAAPAAQGGFNF